MPSSPNPSVKSVILDVQSSPDPYSTVVYVIPSAYHFGLPIGRQASIYA